MKISEALQILRSAPAEGSSLHVLLACGFTPLHLQTLLAAQLQLARPDRKIAVQTGLFGDLAGTLSRAANEPVHAIAVAMEWADLDPRLGYRSLGGWGAQEEMDILAQLRSALRTFERLMGQVSERHPVIASMPTLPLPPAFHTAAAQAAAAQVEILNAIHDFEGRIAAMPNVRMVNALLLDIDSPPGARYDLKSDLLIGFPYSLDHASCLARRLAQVIAPAAPKKGLITDLDDTLWKGIVGDAGADGVSWDLASHSQLHGLYQQTLRALADQGVLIAIASKNEPAAVDEAFARPDIMLSKDRIFPMEIHWNAKSGSVARVLKAWNIAADSVVFVDDSPMELAEVNRAHPNMECLLFPKDDYRAFDGFLRHLRDVFGKPHLSAEDATRRESLRQASGFKEELASGLASDAFLNSLNASVSVDTDAGGDPRSLELVNKTNQFNLNGIRFDAGEWQASVREPGRFVWSVSYRDKFGELGKIAVIRGHRTAGECGKTIVIECWVMSCRAFARRIEHQSLKSLFDRMDANEIRFKFVATAKNGPCAEFIAAFAEQTPEGVWTLKREGFAERCPALFHLVNISGPTVPAEFAEDKSAARKI